MLHRFNYIHTLQDHGNYMHYLEDYIHPFKERESDNQEWYERGIIKPINLFEIIQSSLAYSIQWILNLIGN